MTAENIIPNIHVIGLFIFISDFYWFPAIIYRNGLSFKLLFPFKS